jgi:hypothetical protein
MNLFKKITDLDVKVKIGAITVNVFHINYEEPIPSWGYEAHSHSSYELHLIPKGYGTLTIANKQYRIGPGTFYFTGPGVVHEQIADTVDPMSEFCINFEFDVSKRKPTKTDIYLHDEIREIVRILTNTHFWFGQDDLNKPPYLRTCTPSWTDG